jgi:hypothetical protein
MDFHLSTAEAFHYPDHADGITLLVTLNAGGHTVEALAKVDTGASLCLFSREIGLHLGLVIEQGMHTTLNTLTGPLEAFGHEVRLEVGALVFDTVVYFAKHPGLPRNFLGRQGWLRNVRLGLVDYENTLYLAKYTG